MREDEWSERGRTKAFVGERRCLHRCPGDALADEAASLHSASGLSSATPLHQVCSASGKHCSHPRASRRAFLFRFGRVVEPTEERPLSGMTTPSSDSIEAPSASVEQIQEEFAGISLDPPPVPNGNEGTFHEPAPVMVKPTEKSVKMMLFGGAISCRFPPRFKDVSDVRDVPNNQEAFVDANRDESLIIELLELKENVSDAGSARWFLEDLAMEQGSEKSLIVEDESRVPSTNVLDLEAATTVNTVIGTMTISKGRQGPEAANLVRVYLANIRLKGVETDILITVYEPLLISEHSESASTVGAGETVPATMAECLPAADVFKQIVSTFRIHDWTLFGYVDE